MHILSPRYGRLSMLSFFSLKNGFLQSKRVKDSSLSPNFVNSLTITKKCILGTDKVAGLGT